MTATPRAQATWSLYLLRCGDGTLYTGIATDVERRLGEHLDGARGARYLRGRGPLELLVAEPVGDRALASRAERRVKRLPRARKEQLIAAPERLAALLAELS